MFITYRSHAPAYPLGHKWECSEGRSSVAKQNELRCFNLNGTQRWSVGACIPIYAPEGTPERGNDKRVRRGGSLVGRACCLCPTSPCLEMSGNEKMLPDLPGYVFNKQHKRNDPVK